MLVAFTGAGISSASGIKTFQDQPELRDALYRQVAQTDPVRYRKAIQTMKDAVAKAKPNDAHKALADYDIDIITMNIDGLHDRAGSRPMAIHGTLPSDEEMAYCEKLYNKPVLYGDPAPLYSSAIEKVAGLTSKDILLVVGVSYYTQIASVIAAMAREVGAEIIEINHDSEILVRKTLDQLRQEKRI